MSKKKNSHPERREGHTGRMTLNCHGRPLFLSSLSHGTGRQFESELPLLHMECVQETWLFHMCGQIGQLILKTYLGMETVYPRMGY